MIGFAASIITFVFWVVVGVIVIIQGVITSRLLAHNRRWAAVGVWLIYPVVFAYFGYGELRTNLAAQEYASREMPVTVEVVRKILYMNPKVYLGDFDMHKTCDRGCLTILKVDALDSIAVPRGGSFQVYRLERGKACKQAAEIGRAIKLEQTGKLASHGYFNECLTAEFVSAYDYDIKIDFGGRAMKRPYGPCCAIAEIYERGAEGPRFVARWEGKYHTSSSFSAATIIEKLTGGDFESHLKRRPAGPVDEELALLEQLQAQGTYFPAWRYTSEWIKHVFKQQAKTEGVKRISLSDHDIESLLRIAPHNGQLNFESHFRNYDRLLDENSLERLKEAEAKRQVNG